MTRFQQMQRDTEALVAAMPPEYTMPPALHRDDGLVKTSLELTLIRALIVEAQDRSDTYDHQKLRALADVAAAHWGTGTGDVA